MILLVTDTSGKDGFVGLVRAGEAADRIELIEEVQLAGGTFSAQLVPQISGLLAKHGLSKIDVGAFAVVSGPGSFTGLRVGLAAIKALAEILQKPIVPVSLLEVIAVSNGVKGRIATAIDAGRGEVYVGEYDVADQSAALVHETLVTKDGFLAAAMKGNVATPDAALAAVIRGSGRAISVVPVPKADAIARVGWFKLQKGQTVSPEQLEANYIRRSDAEIFPQPASRA